MEWNHPPLYILELSYVYSNLYVTNVKLVNIQLVCVIAIRGFLQRKGRVLEDATETGYSTAMFICPQYDLSESRVTSPCAIGH